MGRRRADYWDSAHIRRVAAEEQQSAKLAWASHCQPGSLGVKYCATARGDNRGTLNDVVTIPG